MGKVIVGMLAIGAVALGVAFFTGNADVSVTDQGRANVDSAKEAVQEQAQQAGESAQEAMEKALQEGKRRIHDATAE